MRKTRRAALWMGLLAMPFCGCSGNNSSQGGNTDTVARVEMITCSLDDEGMKQVLEISAPDQNEDADTMNILLVMSAEDLGQEDLSVMEEMGDYLRAGLAGILGVDEEAITVTTKEDSIEVRASLNTAQAIRAYLVDQEGFEEDCSLKIVDLKERLESMGSACS